MSIYCHTLLLTNDNIISVTINANIEIISKLILILILKMDGENVLNHQ